MKPRSEGTSWAALPPELMAEILCRIPVKSLLQIRCVSKLWRIFIDSSYFIETHLNRSSIKARESQFLILCKSSSDVVSSVDLEFLENKVDLQNPLEPASPRVKRRSFSRCREIIPRFRSIPDPIQIIDTQWQKLPWPRQCKVQVWGSCNGLVLISNSFWICLWNPSTRKHRNLPSLDLRSSSFPERPVHFYGFGYDSSRDDYKVIKILMCKNWEENHTQYEVWVYSLQSNSWTKVRKSFPLDMKCESQPGVLVHEALYWPVKLKSAMDDDYILAFDLNTEDYRMSPQPKCQNAEFHSRLGTFNGSLLCLIYSYMPIGYEIWVMGESWTRVTLQRGDFISYPGGFISSTLRDGKEVMLHRNLAVTRWLTFDPNTPEEVPLKIFYELSDRNSDVCKVSLVSPDGATASAQ